MRLALLLLMSLLLEESAKMQREQKEQGLKEWGPTITLSRQVHRWVDSWPVL
jgi:hypothetical protein